MERSTEARSPAAEYAGGFDQVELTLAAGASRLAVALYYQITSREYIEFLRDEINGTGTSLRSPTPSGETVAYIIQTDPFFSQLRAWGNTLWQLWTHNMNVTTAAPYLMAQAEVDGEPVATGWNADVFRNGTWDASIDSVASLGQTGDSPAVGGWK